MSDKEFTSTSRMLAFISDIHGNLPALEAVLAELAGRQIEEIYVAGDLLYGGDQPLEVWTRLQEVGARCTLGTSDKALAAVDPALLKPADEREKHKAEQFAETKKRLGDIVLKQLGRLPARLRVPLADGSEILVVHGCPGDPFEPISHDLNDEEILELLADDSAEIVICGGTHVPFDRQIGQVRVINVGSVGESPAGACAHYTVITSTESETLVEHDWVYYER